MKLKDNTWQFIKYRLWNEKNLQHILKKWTWVILLKKPLFLSILEPLSAHAIQAGCVKLRWKPRKDLKTPIWLYPLVFADVSFNRSTCSDPSVMPEMDEPERLMRCTDARNESSSHTAQAPRDILA